VYNDVNKNDLAAFGNAGSFPVAESRPSAATLTMVASRAPDCVPILAVPDRALTKTSKYMKVFRVLARVIPRCGMASQAVAFNMFLAFFPILLLALSLVSGSLGPKDVQEIVARLSTILPPGDAQFVSDSLLHNQASAWQWAVIGWFGTILVGSQVIKLIMEGIHLIYGDRERGTFLGRQLRGVLLFCVTIGAWLVAVALSVFGPPLRLWLARGLGNSLLVRGFWNLVLPSLAMVLVMLVLALIYRVARPGATTWRSVFPGAAAATILWWCVNVLFGIFVRKIESGVTYGNVTAVIGLMLWMELSAMTVFLGAAWNAECAAGSSCSKEF
jgi:membrane protein